MLGEYVIKGNGDGTTSDEATANVVTFEGKTVAETGADKLARIGNDYYTNTDGKLVAITDKDELEKYTKVLYAQARLIEGLPIDNPTEVTNLICEIMS